MSKSRIDQTDRLAAMFQALSNPQRLRLFQKLMDCCPPGECSAFSDSGIRRCVGDLSMDLGLAASTVSYHLKELRQAGLMQVARRGKMIECWIDADAVRLLAAFFIDTRESSTCRVKRTAGEPVVAAGGGKVAVKPGGKRGVRSR